MAKIAQKIIEHEESLHEHHEHVKFLVSIEGSKADEIVAYNDILEYLEEALLDDSTEQLWKFKYITAPKDHLSLLIHAIRDHNIRSS